MTNDIIKGKQTLEWIEWECYNCHTRHKSHSYFKGMIIQCSKCWKGNQL